MQSGQPPLILELPFIVFNQNIPHHARNNEKNKKLPTILVGDSPGFHHYSTFLSSLTLSIGLQ
jgi:hypothetical protein